MFRRRLAYFLSLFPFRLNFFLLLGFAWLAAYLIKHHYYISETYFGTVLTAVLLFITWMAAFVLVTAFLTTFSCWLFFILIRPRSTRGNTRLNVMFGESIHAEAGEVPVTIELPGAIRPLLGYVKGRILFSDLNSSDMIVFDSAMKEKRKFWRIGIKGMKRVWLPDRRDYLVARGVVYFQDMFQMFSFPYTEIIDKRMYTTPPQQEERNVKVDPNKTEQTEVRIETLKRVEGEYLNYKNFESSDDVRRIVWKIYARSRELVVRIPEIMDPYASHINFLASFYNGFPGQGSDKFNAELLNYYKDNVRALYETLKKQGADVRYIADQETLKAFEVPENEKVLYQISTSKWQSDRDPRSFYNNNETAVVCISSLVPAEEVRALLEARGSKATVFFIKVSEALEGGWKINLKVLFVQSPPNPLKQLKKRWRFSRYRKTIIKNEKALAEVLAQHEMEAVTI